MKKIFSTLFLTLLLATVLHSCKKENQTVEVTGVIQKQGATTYQYGTHILIENSKTYALSSEKVQLDQYVNKTVTIRGCKAEGVAGGPEHIEVKRVK